MKASSDTQHQACVYETTLLEDAIAFKEHFSTVNDKSIQNLSFGELFPLGWRLGLGHGLLPGDAERLERQLQPRLGELPYTHVLNNGLL